MCPRLANGVGKGGAPTMRKASSAVIGVAIRLACGATTAAQDTVRVDPNLPLTGPLVGAGDRTDNGVLNGSGDVALAVTTSHHYSALHPSALNKALPISARSS